VSQALKKLKQKSEAWAAMTEFKRNSYSLHPASIFSHRYYYLFHRDSIFGKKGSRGALKP